MSNTAKIQMITSKEVLDITGISRATLHNYIKMGVLPKPKIGKPPINTSGIKQIGYFPKTVLDTLDLVKQYKQDGLSMEEISRRLEMSFSQQKYPPLNHGDEIMKSDAAQPKITPFRSRPANEKQLTISLGDIKFPALLVNHNFEIEWINRQAEEQIFNQAVRNIGEIESRNIFKLFFSWEFNSALRNWESVVAYHLSFAKSKIQKHEIADLYLEISPSEIRFLEKLYDDESHSPDEGISSASLNFSKKDGSAVSYQVYSMYFREGIFFVYMPADRKANDVIHILSQREKIINELLSHRMPALVSFCVLVADLQDSVKISAELLPKDYFDLINELWKTLQDVFDQYDGIYGKHAGDGMLYYFIKKPGSNYMMNALKCALEIKEKMKAFSSEWKHRKGWTNDLHINIGINEGQEFFGTVRSSSHIEFTVLGDTINYASRLSDFAHQGSIWTTKNVVSKLNFQDRENLRFGIYRASQDRDRDIFVENSFSRVIDLLGKDEQFGSKFLEISALPITEILAYRSTPNDN